MRAGTEKGSEDQSPDAARDSSPPAYPPCSLVELSAGESSVLATVVESRWSWVARIYFVLANHEPDVISLAARGLVECFEEPLAAVAMPSYAPEGPGVTLTPYAASLLGVELVPCLDRGGAETERSRWERIKVDADGERLREKRGRGVRVPRSFGFATIHLPQKDAELILDSADGPEYLTDEYNGEVVMCFAGGANAPTVNPGSPAAMLLGGLGGGSQSRGIPIVRDKRLKGKK